MTIKDLWPMAVWYVGLLIGIVLLLTVWSNDAGSATEVALLNGTPVARATDNQCDALYEAIYKVKGEKNHYQLINIAVSLDCPFENE